MSYLADWVALSVILLVAIFYAGTLKFWDRYAEYVAAVIVSEPAGSPLATKGRKQ